MISLIYQGPTLTPSLQAIATVPPTAPTLKPLVLSVVGGRCLVVLPRYRRPVAGDNPFQLTRLPASPRLKVTEKHVSPSARLSRHQQRDWHPILNDLFPSQIPPLDVEAS